MVLLRACLGYAKTQRSLVLAMAFFFSFGYGLLILILIIENS